VNLLLVEDEARVSDFIQRGLAAEGWSVSLASDGESAIDIIEREEFDLILLDLMLPGISGQDVCRRVRAMKNTTPILMLTALGRVDDRIEGLRLGADDYLAKPFDFDELIARIDALIRRAKGFTGSEDDPHILQIGNLRFDTKAVEVSCGDTAIDLSAKERAILQMFMADPNRVFSRERILNAVWGVNEDPLTNVVDVYVSRLRKKLGPCGEGLKTIRGAGYRLSPK